MKQSRQTDETAFWAWVDSQKEGGWIRYDVDVARALASMPAALVLASAIHKTCIRGNSIHASGRWFYMSVEDWMEEVYIRKADTKRALSLLCIDYKPREIKFASAAAGAGRPGKSGVRVGRVRRSRPGGYGLGLMQRWVTNRLADGGSIVTHYRVNFDRLRAWWQVNGIGQTEISAPMQNGGGEEGAFVQTEQIDLLKQNKLICSPITNRFALEDQTSVDIPQDSSGQKITTGQIDSVSASAGRAPTGDPAIFDDWAQTDTAQAMRELLGREGVSDSHGNLTGCLVKMWERRRGYTDLVAGVAELRQTFAASNGSLKNWQGWIVRNIYDGSLAEFAPATVDG